MHCTVASALKYISKGYFMIDQQIVRHLCNTVMSFTSPVFSFTCPRRDDSSDSQDVLIRSNVHTRLSGCLSDPNSLLRNSFN